MLENNKRSSNAALPPWTRRSSGQSRARAARASRRAAQLFTQPPARRGRRSEGWSKRSCAGAQLCQKPPARGGGGPQGRTLARAGSAAQSRTRDGSRREPVRVGRLQLAIVARAPPLGRVRAGVMWFFAELIDRCNQIGGIPGFEMTTSAPNCSGRSSRSNPVMNAKGIERSRSRCTRGSACLAARGR